MSHESCTCDASLLHLSLPYRQVKLLFNAALQNVNLPPDEVSDALSLQSYT